MDEPSAVAVPAGAPDLRLRGAPRRHLWILAACMAAYFAVSLTLSYLRVLEFTVSNWDLGIFQQALWTTPRGFVFFEAGDWETWATVSFLQVHPALILYLLVPVYTVAPYPITLLSIQSGAVALAALPLYQFGRRLFPEPRRALVLSALYLAYAPVLTSNLYDFHLEAFLPLELFLLFLFWWDGRYLLGLVVAAAAYTTLEVAPFLVAAIALYFLASPPAQDPAGAVAPRTNGRRSPLGSPGVRLRELLAGRRFRWSVLLLVLSGAAYLCLRGFQWWVLPAFLGVPPRPPVGAGGITGAASASGLGLTFTLLPNLGLKIGYWLLLTALLGLLPLFAPRSWILAVPWFFFTMQSDRIAWVELGYQYGFLAAIPLVLAAFLGLRNLEKTVLPRLRDWWSRAGARARRWDVRVRRFRNRRTVKVAVAVTLAALVVVNVYLTPADPLRQNLKSALSAYRVTYTPVAGYPAVVHLASLLPANAPVLASDDLFPLVANDAQAYSLLWVPSQPNYLPFDARHLPTFVFLSTDQAFAVPSWLYVALTNHSLYGLRGSVAGSPVGAVHLWERGYTGVPVTFGTAAESVPSWSGSAPVEGAMLAYRAGEPAGPARSVWRHSSATAGSR